MERRNLSNLENEEFMECYILVLSKPKIIGYWKLTLSLLAIKTCSGYHNIFQLISQIIQLEIDR